MDDFRGLPGWELRVMAEALLAEDVGGDDEAWTHSDENLAALKSAVAAIPTL